MKINLKSLLSKAAKTLKELVLKYATRRKSSESNP